MLIVPALVYGLGFDQKLATGTSLAILLPPVGLAAVLEYHRRGDVDRKRPVSTVQTGAESLRGRSSG